MSLTIQTNELFPQSRNHPGTHDWPHTDALITKLIRGETTHGYTNPKGVSFIRSLLYCTIPLLSCCSSRTFRLVWRYYPFRSSSPSLSVSLLKLINRIAIFIAAPCNFCNVHIIKSTGIRNKYWVQGISINYSKFIWH